jgi:predicted hydrocarbon binding protein
MAGTTNRQAELALPATALTALRNALVASVGPDAAADALRAAGYAAGDAFFRILTAGDGESIAQLGADLFWQRLSLLFSARGWGHLSYSEAHPGVGSLHAGDWAEAIGDGSGDATCHLSTGLLANLLGQVAGSEVAVLEVECRGRGDQRCRFLFGGRDAVYAVYERLSAGAAPEAALASID